MSGYACRENDFEDGAQSLYRFLEHDPAVPRYYNFRGSTNDGEPKPAAAVGQRFPLDKLPPRHPPGQPRTSPPEIRTSRWEEPRAKMIRNGSGERGMGNHLTP